MREKKKEIRSLRVQVIKNIKHFRELSGMTQEDLSLKIGRKEDFISKVENLEYMSLPRIDDIENIARALNIPIDNFLSRGMEGKENEE